MGERKRNVVHGEDRGVVARAQLAENIRALATVERRHRLVGDDDRALVVESTGDRSALLLAAGQRPRLLEQLVGEPHEFERAFDLGDIAPRRPHQITQIVPSRVSIEPAHIDVVEDR